MSYTDSCPPQSDVVRLARRRTRGMALATMLTLTVLLAIATLSVSTVVVNTLRSNTIRGDQVEALNMADAGIDLAVAWIQQQASPPDDTKLHPLANFYGTNGTITAPFGQAGTSLQIAIYSDAANTGPVQKHYVIESKAIMPGGATKTVRAYIAQQSFGDYAFFADIDSGGFWTYNNHFEGKFHSNCSDSKPSTFLWKNPPPDGLPIFLYNGPDAFSTSLSSTSVSSDNTVAWWDSVSHVKTPANASDWDSIAEGGRSTVTYGYLTDPNTGAVLYDSAGKPKPRSPSIPIPATDYLQAYVALGRTIPSSATTLPTGLPTAAGATVTVPNGGLYIHGQTAMTFGVDTSGNQTITVVAAVSGNTQTQTVTVDPVANTTKVQTVTKNSSGTTLSNTTVTNTGVPNGMIFADDNITALSGTVADNKLDVNNNILYRNQWTLATNTAASKDITLSDSVKYNTARDLSKTQALDTNFNTKAGTLGLIARNINLKDGAPAQVEFDCAIFCTGTFQAATTHANWPAGSANAKMNNIGGVVVKTSGIFAYADNSGNVTSGWNEEYHYDTRMADHPPPYFPTTGNNYTVMSWQTVGSTIQ